MNMPITSWKKTLRALGYRVVSNPASAKKRQKVQNDCQYEVLEPRQMMVGDLGLVLQAELDQQLDLESDPIVARLGQLDENASQDLVVLSSSGELTVATNGENNSWQTVQTVDLGIGPTHGLELTLVNDDPFADLLLQGSDEIFVALNNGQGQFSISDTLNPLGAGQLGLGTNVESLRLLPGDFNGDLNGDFAAISPATDQLIIYLGVGDGTFSNPIFEATGGSEPVSIALGDFVGDSLSDIVVGHADGVVSFLENRSGDFALRPDLARSFNGSINDLAAADVNVDGDVDIVVSSGDDVTILQNEKAELSLPRVLNNGSFSTGLNGWNVVTTGEPIGGVAGSIVSQSGFVQLTENESFVVSLNQDFTVPDDPQTIQIDLLSIGLEDPAGGIPDAFEISLLDENENSLVPVFKPGASSFFNVNPGSDIALAPGVAFDGTTVTLDISAVAPGIVATLYLDLIGSGPGTSSTVTIDNIRITPENDFDSSFTATTLTGPFVDVNQLAIADVDGDQRLDIVATDRGSEPLLVFNQRSNDSFDREEIDISSLGTGLSSLAVAPLTTGDSVSDVVVVASDQRSVISPLESDVVAPTAELVSPLPDQTNVGDVFRVDIRFNEQMRDIGLGDSASITNAENYVINFFGPDGLANSGDDSLLSIESVAYEPLTGLLTLNIDPLSTPLQDGVYEVVLNSANIRDVSDNPLSDGNDVSFQFTMNSFGPAISPVENINAFEGSVVQLMADFTDAGGATPYTAEIDWGDGSVTLANIVNFNAGVGMIGASHIYADNGSYDIMVTIIDANSVASQAFTTATVQNVGPSVSPIEPTETVVRNQEVDLQVATFSDAGFDNINTGTGESFTATIDWGDGTTTTGIVDRITGMPGLPSTGSVYGSHTYALEGEYTVTITVTDDDGGVGHSIFDVTVQTDAPELSPVGQISATEGSLIDLETDFTDLGNPGTYAGVVDWGDGVVEAASVTFSAGFGTISASHVYADDGEYTVTFDVSDPDANVAVASGLVSISNASPILSAPDNQAINVGDTIDLIVGSFTDPGFTSQVTGTSESFTAVIDWGDGTTTSDPLLDVTNGGPGIDTTGTITASHQFLVSGVYTVTVSLSDDDGDTTLDSFEVDVLEADTGAWLPNIDFETDAAGNHLERGTILAEQWSDWGVHVTTHDPTHHPAMIFDSANPTGGDTDLATSDQQHILIISEDSDSSDPDDNASGGVLVFDFDNPVMLDRINLLDIDSNEYVTFRQFNDAGSLVDEQVVAGAGDSTPLSVDLAATNLSRLEVELTGSGAITDLIFCLDGHPGAVVNATGSTTSFEGSTYELALAENAATISHWVVNWGDGSVETFGSGINPNHVFGDDGLAKVLATAYAADGNIYRTEPLVVEVANIAPVLNITTDVVETQAGSVVEIQLDSSDPGNDTISQWSIDWGDGTPPTIVEGSDTAATHVYTFAGDFTISATATDEDTTGDPYFSNSLSITVTPGADVKLPNINFERSADGLVLQRGEIITDQFADLGLNVTTHDPVNHPAMIFDSSWPTGHDYDLGTPNWDFGGPGWGYGGRYGAAGQNDTALGNVLIISENANPWNPDDDISGGTFIFTFDQSVMVDEVDLLDIEGTGTEIRLYDGGGHLIQETPVLGLGNNSVQTVELNGSGVARMEVEFSGGGAITDIIFCREGHPIEPAPTKFFTVDGYSDRGFHYDQQGNQTDSFDLRSHAVARGVTTTPDGDPVWVLKSNEFVYVYDRINNEYLGKWDAIGPRWGRGIATDGNDIWIADAKNDRIYFYEGGANWTSGAHVATNTFDLHHFNYNPSGLAVHGDTLWVTDASSDQVFIYETDGDYLGRWNLDSYNSKSSGITTDVTGENLWVTDFKDGLIYYYEGAASRRSGSQSATSVIQLAPNNQHPEGIADPVETIQIGDLVAGSIANAGDVNELLFNATAGQTVYFDFQTQSGGVLNIELIAPDGSSIFTDTGTFANALDNGPINLDQTGNYVLQITSNGTSTPSYEFELVDVPATAITPLSLGQLASGAIDVQGEIDQFQFAATAGEVVYVDFLSAGGGGLVVEGTNPDDSSLFSDSGTFAGAVDNGPFTLQQTGTYTITLSGSNDDTPNYQFRVVDVPARQIVNLVLGQFVSGNITVPGQEIEYQFSATSGQDVFLDFANFSGGTLDIALVAPDGSTILTDDGNNELTIDNGPVTLPQSGIYSLIVDGRNDDTPTFDLRVVDVPATSVTTILLDQQIDDTFDAPGQVKQYQFDASAGQRIFYDMLTLVDGQIDIDLIAPDGSTVFVDGGFNTFLLDNGPIELEQNGTYTFTVDPRRDDTPTFSFNFFAVAPDNVQTIDRGATVVDMIDGPFSRDIFEFDAVAGEETLVLFEALSGGAIAWRLEAPDGTLIDNSLTSDFLIDLDSPVLSLDQTGTYRFTITAESSTTPSYQFRLFDIPAPEFGLLEFDVVTTGTINAPGATDVLEFGANSGDELFVDFLAVSDDTSYRIVAPDGSVVVSTLAQFLPNNLDDLSILLDQNGTYRFELRGNNFNAPTYRFTAGLVPDPDVSDLVYGQPNVGSIEVLPAVDQFLFDGVAGDSIYIDWQVLTSVASADSQIQYQLSAPDGSVVASDGDFLLNALDQGPILLPQDGQYIMRTSGLFGDTPDLYRFTIHNVTPDPAIAIEFNTPIPGKIDNPGDAQRYTFNGNAGQSFSFDVLANSSDAEFTLLDPAGVAVFTDQTGDQLVASLPSTGTYTLLADLDADDTGSFSFQIIDDSVIPVLPDGANLVVSSISAPAQIIANPASAQISWTVTNAGPQPTTVSEWSDRVYYSIDDVFGNADDQIFENIGRDGILLPGESYTAMATIPFAADTNGEFQIFIETDALNQVYEAGDLIDNVAKSANGTAVYPTDRTGTSTSNIEVDIADGSVFESGTTVSLTGQASTFAGSVNLIYVLDISGSTAQTVGLDANSDGLFDFADDLNGDGSIGDILDVEIGAVLSSIDQALTQSVDLQVAVLAFAETSQLVDLGPALFNQTFVDPTTDLNNNEIADFKEALLTVNVNSGVLFEPFSVASGTDFQEPLQRLDGLLQRAQDVDQTQVWFLTDGEGLVNPTADDIQNVANAPLQFNAVQIDGAAVTQSLQDVVDLIDLGTSTATAQLVSDPSNLADVILANQEITEVRINGTPVDLLDGNGNFASDVTLADGNNSFLIEAFSGSNLVSSRNVNIVGDVGNIFEIDNLVDIGILEGVYTNTTFNRSTNQLHVDLAVTNNDDFAIAPIVAGLFEGIDNPGVSVANAAGVNADGFSYVEFDSEISGASLASGQTSAPIGITFNNSLRNRFAADVTFLVSENRVPMVTTSPVLTALANDLYQYELTATDDNGDMLSFSILAAPDELTIDTTVAGIALLEWTPTSADTGNHWISILVDDGRGGSVTQTYDLLVPSGLTNQPPLILSEPENRLATIDEAFEYDILAEDPEGQPVTFSLGDDTPAGVALNGSQLSWTPLALDLGTNVIELVASDPDGASSRQSFRLEVRDGNTAPIFVSTPEQSVFVGESFDYRAIATDPEDSVVYSLVDGPSEVDINSFSGQITFTPDASQSGAEIQFTVRATDDRGVFTDQSFMLSILADEISPELQIVVTDTVLNVGDSIQVQILAQDATGIASRSLTINGAPITLDTNNVGTFTATESGLPLIVASATDHSDNTTIVEQRIRVIDPTDTSGPIVQISSPIAGGSVTYLADVVGSVVGDDLDTWFLEYALRGTGNWVRFAEGSTEFSNSAFATLDPTLLQNDNYDLRLSAFDFSGNIESTTIVVAVDGQAKLGNYTLEFTDLAVPLAGIPITITRQYDSLNASFSQDFGHGWRLSIGEARIRETVPVSQAEREGVPALFGGADALFVGSRVYATTPDGQRVGFTFDPEPVPGLLGTAWKPRFVSDVDTNFELQVGDVNLQQRPDGTFGLFLFGGNYNPREYTLVSTDQIRYTYDQFDELKSVSDRNGVTSDYRDNGIFSSTGGAITWTRDEFGRINQIIDPSGNTLTYNYDAAGDLISYSDQVGNTWTYAYDAIRPHFLERVTGPRGNTINEVRYDDSGRFVAVVDGLGNEITQNYDLPNNTFVQTDAVGNVTELTFDERGNITQVVDGRGNSSFAEYNDPNNQHLETSVTDPRGITTEFTYDSRGNITSIVEDDRSTIVEYNENNDILRIEGPTPLNAGPDFEPNVVTMTYDANGNLASFTNAEGETELTVSDSFGRPVSVTDAVGNVMQLTYGSFSDPDVITFADGSIRTTVRDEKGLLELVTNEVGEVIDFAYDEAGRPLGVTDALGQIYENVYQDDLLVSTIDPLGRTTTFDYDEKNRLVKITDAIGGEITRNYDANNRVLSVTNQLGQTESWIYSANNEITSFTDAAGETTNYTYDEFSNLLSIENARGFVTTFEYDDRNRLIRDTDALGNQELYGYDERDNLTSITDRNGAVTELAYDRVGRLVSLTDALGGVQSRIYDEVGNNISFTDELGNETTFEYDVRARLIGQTDAAGFEQSWLYDEANRLIQFTDQEGFDSFFEYDGNNRLISQTDHLGGVVNIGYDAVGNRTSTTDELGRTTSLNYDALDRAIELLDASGSLTQFDYDGLGNLVSITDQLGNETSYQYDSRNQLLVETDPLGNQSTFSYDAMGNLSTSIDRLGRTTQFTYDALNRLTNEIWFADNGSQVDNFDYSYDVNGNLLSAGGTQAGYAFTYDLLDRVTGVESIDAPFLPEFTLSYSYDALGNLTTVQDSFEVSVDRTYDSRNLLESINWSGGSIDDARVEYAYDGRGFITEIDRYSNLAGTNLISETSHSIDALGRIANISHLDSIGSIVADYEFTFDAASQLNQQIINGNSIDYTFDDLGQLLSSDSTIIPAENFDYDDAGNRIDGDSVVGPNNQLSSDGTFNYEYDSEGNLIRRTEIATGEYTVYEFDHRNRMVSAIRFSAGGIIHSQSEFEYNVFDELILRTVDGDGSGPQASESVATVYDNGNAWADFDETGTLIAQYLFGDGLDSNIARFRAGEGTAWYLSDQLGSIRDIVDASGNLINHIEYDSYGNILLETNSIAGDRFKFTGREYQSELGLYYYRARFYDSSTGRFVSQDPIGFNGGDQNLYGYVGNTPLTFTDPTGTTPATTYSRIARVAIAVAGAAAGAAVGYTCGYLEGRFNGQTPQQAHETARDQAVLGAAVGFGIGALSAGGVAAATAIGGSTAGAVAGTVLGGFFTGLGVGLGLINIATAENATIRNLRIACFAAEIVTAKTVTNVTQRAVNTAFRNAAAGNIRLARQILREVGVPTKDINQIIRSFNLESFRVVQTRGSIAGIRVFDGKNAFLEGRFISRESFATPAERIKNLALLNNDATRSALVVIPENRTVFEGIIAPQGDDLPGGASQIFLLGNTETDFSFIEITETITVLF